MNFLTVENLSKTYGEKLLFHDLSFGINQGDRAALIAQNGSGKTTLLNIILGKVLPDEGKVALRNDINVAYLSQTPEFDTSLSVMDAILSSDTKYVNAVKSYELALISGDEKLLQEAIVKMDATQAWDFEHKVKEVLGKLQISDYKQVISTMSGGQKRKVALAKVLLDDVDLLLMDEPTNHLDIDMIEWLETFLIKQKLTLLIVTHDRYFLNNVCDEILELDNNTIYRYKGNYEYFLEKKAERENSELQEVLKARNTYRKELEWIRRMPKARTTKSKARIDAFDDISDKAKRNLNTESIEINVKSSRLGKKILEINNIHKAFGEKVLLKDFSYTFKGGEKIGIVGANGSGKSTFFKMIMGEEKPDMGKIVAGQTIVWGYFSQDTIDDAANKRVIDLVKEVAEEIPVGTSSSLSASQFLSYFKFSHTTQYNYYQNLSGGEKRRLQLLLSLVHNPNFLIFDEPTNDLDIDTLNILEDFLGKFGGCLLIASHDRAFLDKIVDHIFVFDGIGNVKDYHYSYSEFRVKKEEEEWLEKQKVIKEKDVPAKADRTNAKKKPSFKQLKQKELLEFEIDRLEKLKSEISEKLNTELDHEKLIQLSHDFSKTDIELEEKTMEWLELMEEIESY